MLPTRPGRPAVVPRGAITLLCSVVLMAASGCSGVAATAPVLREPPRSLTAPAAPAAAAAVTVADAPAPTSAAFFVSSGPTGADLNPGTRAAPWRTIQYAVDHVPDHAVIVVEKGTYADFTITHPLVVRGVSRLGVVVTSPTAPNLIEVGATGSVVEDLTVAGCVPDPTPPGGIDDHPSAGIRVDDGADGVRILRVTVRDGSRPGPSTPTIGCHGIFLHGADRVTVARSEIYGNGSGIYVVGGGRHDRLVRNDVHDNTALIRNTPTSVNDDDDFGAVGIGFVGLTEAPGPLAKGNDIEHNRGASYDYGTDGGGFEIFQASHVTMRRNTLVDNDEILETGTSSASKVCAGNVFAHNTTYGTTSTDADSLSKGMILRCAQNMRITHNTITDADYWAFVVGGDDAFSSSIRGLTIAHNVVDQTYDQMFASTVAPAAWDAAIDHNTYTWQCDGTYRFATMPGGRAASLTAWQQVTPYDADSSGSMHTC